MASPLVFRNRPPLPLAVSALTHTVSTSELIENGVGDLKRPLRSHTAFSAPGVLNTCYGNHTHSHTHTHIHTHTHTHTHTQTHKLTMH